MITLSIAPDGTMQAFCDPQGPHDRGYYLDLPTDPTDALRILYQALLKRGARQNNAGHAPVDLKAIVQWLEAHPPIPRTKSGQPIKQTAQMSDLEGLF